MSSTVELKKIMGLLGHGEEDDIDNIIFIYIQDILYTQDIILYTQDIL